MKYLADELRLRLAVVGQEVDAGALHAAGLVEAGRCRAGGSACHVADELAAAGQQQRVRSMPATTALRTLMSSNGLIVVFIETQRPPPLGDQHELVLRFCARP